MARTHIKGVAARAVAAAVAAVPAGVVIAPVPEAVVVASAPAGLVVTPAPKGTEVTAQGRVTEIVTPSTATNPVAVALDKVLIPNWRQAHKLRTVQVAVFWTVVFALWSSLPAFTYLIPVHYFLIANMVFALAVLYARLTKQPGVVG